MQKSHVVLKEWERTYLQSKLSKGALNVRVQRRIVGLLELDKGKSYQSVATLFGMSYPTIQGWGKKYRTEGLNFIEDKPRSGRPVRRGGTEKAKIVAVACSTPPEGYAKWSLRLLADHLVELSIVDQISHTEVGRI